MQMTWHLLPPDFGYVTLSTPEAFVLHDGDEWPESGTLTVTGANDSNAKLTANDHLKPAQWNLIVTEMVPMSGIRIL
jgi:hypothetical protein